MDAPLSSVTGVLDNPSKAMRPSGETLEALSEALRTLDQLLGAAVNRRAQTLGPMTLLDAWRGMHLERSDIEPLLSAPEAALRGAEGAGALLAAAARTVPALTDTENDHSLSTDDLAALLITIAPDLDLKYEKIYGYLQDDVTRKRPTPDLIANLLAVDSRQRLRVLARLSTDAPLMRAGLIASTETADVPWLARTLVPDATWFNRLLGRDVLDPAFASCAKLVDADAGRGTSAYTYTSELRARVHRAAEAHGRVHLTLCGPHGAGKFALAKAIAADLGKRLLVVDAREWKTPNEVRTQLIRAARVGKWLDALVYVHGVGRFSERDPQLTRAVMESLEHASTQVVIASVAAIGHVPGVLVDLLHVEVALPPHTVRQAMWRRALAAHGRTVDEQEIRHVASRFVMGPLQIEQAAHDAVGRTTDAEPTLSHGSLAAAARAQSSAQLAGLAQRIAPEAGLESLVVPSDVRAQLREICVRVTSRESVRRDWGAGSVHSRVIGVTALFAGPSGTGKTLAAEAIAHELGFDMYRIELASIVSKYIGETERNLERVFTAAEHANAVLFFDEADALFGKRSEVKDAHDRYANIEIAYLLQKMERFDGLAVLATNLKQNLDEAFARRLTFTVNFPFPEQAERRQLWETVWPPRAPRAPDVDLDWFAREFRLSGGGIRNVVLAAAHLAADEGQTIGRAHLLHAVRREFQKVGEEYRRGGAQRREVGMMGSAASAKSTARLEPSALSRNKHAARPRTRAGMHAGEPLQALVGNYALSQLLRGGAALPQNVRTEMEERFGADFADVRVHVDPMAHAVTTALSAKALTHGSDIVFGRGRFAPASVEGRHLLAHELAHVVQQRRGGTAPSGQRGSFNESAAESAAARVAYGTGPVAVDGASGVGVARAELDEPSASDDVGVAGAELDEPSASDDAAGAMLNAFRRSLLDAILSNAEQYGGAGDVLVAKAIEGMSDQAFQELWVEGRGKALLLNFVNLGAGGVAKAAVGYNIGLVEGMASPLTDMFGMAVFAENARNMLWSLAKSAYNASDQIGPEIQALLDQADVLATSADTALRAFVNDPDALKTLLSLSEAASVRARTKAYELGQAGASKVVKALESPWAEDKAAAPAPEFGLTTAFSWAQSKAGALHDWAIASPGTKIGEAVGYAVGLVAVQVILLAITGGLSGVLKGAGSGLARLGTAMSRVSPAAGRVTIGAGKFVTLLGETVASIGHTLNALEDAALQPLRKALAPFIEPLQKFLKALLSVFDKVEDTAKRLEGEELARRIQGPAKPEVDAADAPTQIFEPGAQEKIAAESKARAESEAAKQRLIPPEYPEAMEDWPEIEPARLEVDPQDAPIEELGGEAAERLQSEARQRAETAARPEGADSARASGEAAGPEEPTGKTFLPESESTQARSFRKYPEAEVEDVAPGTRSPTLVPLEEEKAFLPEVEGERGGAGSWTKRSDVEVELPPDAPEIGPSTQTDVQPLEAPRQLERVIEAPVPDSDEAEALAESTKRLYMFEEPARHKPIEITPEGSTELPRAPEPEPPQEKTFVREGPGVRQEGFSKYREDPGAVLEPEAGPTLVPSEDIAPDPAAARGPNDPDQIRLAQEEAEAWKEGWGAPSDVGPESTRRRQRRRRDK